MAPPSDKRTATAGTAGGRLFHQGREAHIADQRSGLAVIDDIGDFIGAQVTIDGGVAQAAAGAGENNFGELRPIAGDHCDRIAGAQSARLQCAGQSIGVGVQLEKTAIASWVK